MHSQWGYITIREIYDGWIVKYNKVTGAVRWRNCEAAWNLSEEKTIQIENYIKKTCINGRKTPKQPE